MSGPEKWALAIALAIAAACPSAIALAGKVEWWIIALTFAGTFAGTVAGRIGMSKPADLREIDRLSPPLPLSSRRLP